MVTQRIDHKWGMVVDLDRCTGCQACVVACQAENNIPINTKEYFQQRRAYEWIRIERYWEGEFPNVKAKFIPILCQHCENAPCEPVCPVFATYHNDEGLNVQVYNRCVGTRYCSVNCPYTVRFFNYWEPQWPDRLRNQLNPDVTVRSRGIMEKCSFCVQRLRRGEVNVERRGLDTLTGQSIPVAERKLNHRQMKEGNYLPSCVQACPTSALQFADQHDETGPVKSYFDEANGHIETREAGGHVNEEETRVYRLFEEVGTKPNLIYLKKVEPFPVEKA
ncbi:MAG: 4Fe-4S dicluster domain-containing protein [Chloroflexi bacterium]|nr:4Fe-4S dicluster domain-containing protein [Chloroflexota bacterium]MDA1270688.1 4Fe-4S dicluster domain-containing protein [Chloroflexota bacterium]PKB59548.1 MAG: 4Fe-4S ferredoxin [SAR202 cluster bacterium Casp-Chloro-G2]